MLQTSTARIVAVVMAISIAALLFFAPRSIPTSNFAGLDPQEARFELGRAYVEHSQTPMVGIKMLQQILDEDPANVYARWYLGTQAIRTGQFRKAIHHLAILYPNLKGEE